MTVEGQLMIRNKWNVCFLLFNERIYIAIKLSFLSVIIVTYASNGLMDVDLMKDSHASSVGFN